ncbi:circular bacteriocin, circularin A/uberolysin family [Bacillus safensis]|uniref:circular bacteriocin, circularin A/uberolysin family n=1 Tax=Bacillus safensis TaxID=561879 RepID=UPI002481DE0F|nr:circular bacteriocin, circularin A/uberolysin family [Bacillus safensis]MDI0275114.1 circular bacteriocin, circularin A/uberolysin family [Bacillus safensis]
MVKSTKSQTLLLIVVATIVSLMFGLMATQLAAAPAAEIQTTFSMLATKLGISQATAGVVIDMIAGGSTLWTIVAAVAGLSGAGLIAVGGITAIKAVIKQNGKKFAVSW